MTATTKLTHAQIAQIVTDVTADITTSGSSYVQQHYPFFQGLAAPIIATLAHQSAIRVVNGLVDKGHLS